MQIFIGVENQGQTTFFEATRLWEKRGLSLILVS